MKNVTKFFSKNITLVVLIVCVVFFSLVSDVFFTVNNITNVIRQVAVTGIAAAGMTMIMLTGGIDLTPGSTVGLVGVVCALLMKETSAPIWVVVLAGIGVGMIIGLINGVLIAYAKMPPLICTLAVMHGIRGLCYILTDGMPIFGFPSEFGFLGKSYIAGIPVPVIILAIVFISISLLLNKTSMGRHIYAIGGNREALRLSGVNVQKRLVQVYGLSGILFGLAGVVLLSRISSAQPSAGNGFEFDVVTAVVLGGISVSGGEGKLFGAITGVLIMGILANGMTLLNIYEYYQMIMKCMVLLIAVLAGEYAKDTQFFKKFKKRKMVE